MRPPERYDVAVIGAGVAGCVAAFYLNRLGYTVALCTCDRLAYASLQSVHADFFERLVYIGMDSILDSSGARPSRSYIRWDREQADTAAKEPSLLVERKKLDAALLDCVRQDGIDIYEDTKGFKYSQRQDAGEWKIHDSQGAINLSSEYLVNASGTIKAGNNHITSGTNTHQIKTLAIRADWRHRALVPDQTQTWLSSEQDFWCWGGSLEDKSSLNIFIDPKMLASQFNGDLYLAFDQLSSRIQWFGEIPQASSDKPALKALNATPCHLPEPISAKKIHVGAAAIRLDPLSSQGMQVAASSAIQAAICINTMVKKPSETCHAIEFYQQKIHHLASSNQAFSAEQYAKVADLMSSEFWSSRGKTSKASISDTSNLGQLHIQQQYSLAEDVRIEKTPYISGDLIKQSYAVKHAQQYDPLFLPDNSRVRSLLQLLHKVPLGELLEREMNSTNDTIEFIRVLQSMLDNDMITPTTEK